MLDHECGGVTLLLQTNRRLRCGFEHGSGITDMESKGEVGDYDVNARVHSKRWILRIHKLTWQINRTVKTCSVQFSLSLPEKMSSIETWKSMKCYFMFR